MSVVLAFLLRHEALVGWPAVLTAAVLTGALLAHRADAPALAHARSQASQAAAVSRAEAAQATLERAAGQAVETARTRESDTTLHTEAYAHAVETAPQADQAVPPDLLRDWARGVDGLRDEAARSRAGAPASGGGDPARAVPAAGPA